MPRKAKKKRQNKKNAEKASFSKKFPVIIVSVIILVTCLVLIRNYLCNAPDFVIEKVVLKGENLAGTYLFDELSQVGMGENIFTVNISDTVSSMKKEYFEIKDIRARRVFPNKLTFYIEKRKAVALIKSRYYYPVDKEGVILRGVKRTIKEGLPVINGVHISKKDIGRKERSQRLSKSLDLLEEMSKSGILDSYNISEINAANKRNLSFYIDDGLEIRIGGEDFRGRLKVLKKTLKDPNVNPLDIRYIDLRFKDVIIGAK